MGDPIESEGGSSQNRRGITRPKGRAGERSRALGDAAQMTEGRQTRL